MTAKSSISSVPSVKDFLRRALSPALDREEAPPPQPGPDMVRPEPAGDDRPR